MPSRPGEFHPEPLSRVESRRGPGFEGCRRFLDPPYHSVRRVFPDTAGRLACRAAPSRTSAGLSLLPAYTGWWWFVSAFRALRGDLGNPALCRDERSFVHRLGGGVASAPGVLARARVMLSRTVIT